MTAPTLPREVWCFVDEGPATRRLESFFSAAAAAECELLSRGYDDPKSPIGRYVLADDKRDRLLAACVDALREIQMNMAGVATGHLAHFTRKDLAGAAEHRAKAALDRLDAYEKACADDAENRLRADPRSICPTCFAMHEPVPVCHECVRLKARREEREEIAAWLRRDSTRESEPAAWEYADAIERGECRRDGR